MTDQLSSTYTRRLDDDPEDRYVVSLILPYSEKELEEDHGLAADMPAFALAAALRLVFADGGLNSTHWAVYDRKTDTKYEIPQDRVAHLVEGIDLTDEEG